MSPLTVFIDRQSPSYLSSIPSGIQISLLHFLASFPLSDDQGGEHKVCLLPRQPCSLLCSPQNPSHASPAVLSVANFEGIPHCTALFLTPDESDGYSLRPAE